MSDTWLSIAEAATHLKVHTRTIERRIASGKIPARRTDDGILQVMLALPDAGESSPDNALDAVRELAADHVTLATGSASALVKFAQDDAARARDELTIIRQYAGRAQKNAVAAWLVVATLVVGVTVAVGWTASKITRANADVRQLTDYAAKMEIANAQMKAERESVRQDAEQAHRSADEATGRLAAYVEQNEKMQRLVVAQRPATQPANVLQRLVAVFASAER